MRIRYSVVAAGLLLLAGLSAPSRASAQLEPTLDSARLLRNLSVLAHDSMAGRATGTPGAQRVRVFLVGELEAAGISPAYAGLLRTFAWSGRSGVNIVGIVHGRAAPDDDVIVITAHYDHLGTRDGEVYNGADDNASGVAALLEIGRQLVATPLGHTAVLAFMDAEEAGLRGSRAFIAEPPLPMERIALNVNLDMVARADGVLWAAGAFHTPALRPVLDRLATTTPLKLRLGHDRPGAPEGDDWTYSSDHAPFHAAGIPFVYLGVEDHPDYHEPTDDLDRIDPGELTASVRTIMMVLRALDRALPLEPAPSR